MALGVALEHLLPVLLVQAVAQELGVPALLAVVLELLLGVGQAQGEGVGVAARLRERVPLVVGVALAQMDVV